MIIRPGAIADIHKICRLWVKMCEETSSNKNPDTESFKKLLRGRINEDKFYTVVAEHGGSIVGFVTAFTYTNTETGLIHGQSPHIYVEEEYRDTDVPRRLYYQIKQIAKKDGCKVHEHYCDEKVKDFWIKKGYKVSKYLMSKEV